MLAVSVASVSESVVVVLVTVVAPMARPLLAWTRPRAAAREPAPALAVRLRRLLLLALVVAAATRVPAVLVRVPAWAAAVVALLSRLVMPLPPPARAKLGRVALVWLELRATARANVEIWERSLLLTDRPVPAAWLTRRSVPGSRVTAATRSPFTLEEAWTAPIVRMRLSFSPPPWLSLNVRESPVASAWIVRVVPALTWRLPTVTVASSPPLTPWSWASIASLMVVLVTTSPRPPAPWAASNTWLRFRATAKPPAKVEMLLGPSGPSWA